MATRIRIGTRGWLHSNWRQDFYPESLSPEQWLKHYSSQFGCVEVDDSFLKVPQKSTVTQWMTMTDETFRLCLQIPRAITHEKKLKNCETHLTNLFTRMSDFHERLGPFVFQLPNQWRCNLPRLQGLLNLLSQEFRYAFEFRHDSWFCPEVFDTLRRYRTASVISKLPKTRQEMTPSTDFSVLKVPSANDNLTGHLSPQTLRAWAIRSLSLKRNAGDVYLIFDDHGDGKALENAQNIASYLSAAENLHVLA